jgi:putative NIF3 family GTP cyclohydrolase 1 type 2
MNTQQVMDIALRLAEINYVPEDSGIIVEGENIKRVMSGISIDAPELLIAKELKVDMVLGHHPSSSTSGLGMSKMLENQIDKMVKCGVPINKAQKAIEGRIIDIERRIQGGNYDRIDSAAKLLKIPYMNIHTPADLISERVVQEKIDECINENSKARLSDIIDALMGIREYKAAVKQQQPKIWAGSPESFAGKVVVTMAGGTSGGPLVAKAYFEAGVGTLVCMHESEETLKIIKEQNIGNLIIAGHMSSDSIGMNTILEELESKGIEVIRMSGIVY